MYYGEIKNCDIANGIGVRVTLFVSGCTNRCKGCFQPETWDFKFGKPYTAETEEELIRLLRPGYIRGLTVLGGEPFEPENQPAVLSLLRRVKKEYPTKDVWIFTGFRYDDELTKEGAYPHREETDEILSLTDILVDGRFEEDKKNIMLKFRGSENQRVIDVKKTRETHELILWDEAGSNN